MGGETRAGEVFKLQILQVGHLFYIVKRNIGADDCGSFNGECNSYGTTASRTSPRDEGRPTREFGLINS